MKTKSLTDSEIKNALEEINFRLKVAKLGVTVQLRGSCLSLVATLPPKPGSPKTKRYQQRIPLKLLANPLGLKRAEAEAKLLGARLASREFDWSFYLNQEKEEQSLIETSGESCWDWLERFKAHIMATTFEKETPEVAELLYRRRFYNQGLNQLDPNKPLTPQAIIDAAQRKTANTRSRQLSCQNLERLAQFAQVQVDLSDYIGNYSSKKAARREIPSAKTIEASIKNFKAADWRWVYGMMATYGIRDHEAFFCEVEWREVEWYGETENNLVLVAKVLDGKTGPRDVFPLHPHWVEKWHLWDVQVPDVTARIHEEYGERVSRAFNRNNIGFVPYDLRHAYAIRASVEYKLPLAVAAYLCGHSPEVHLTKYNRWINEQQHTEAWNDAVIQHKRRRNTIT
jgi:integrase